VSKTESARLVSFALIGAINTAVDFGVFSTLYYATGVDLLFANTLAFLAACLGSFLLNRRYTFADRAGRAGSTGKSMAVFFLVAVCALCVSNVLVWCASLVTSPLVGKAAAVLTSFAINYIGSKRLVFR